MQQNSRNKEDGAGENSMNRSVAFCTLGCRVNQYETQQMREQFGAEGYELRNEDDPADVYVVNTCTVTNMSDRKSRQLIRRFRKKNPDAVIVVTGCYAQMKPEEAAALPGVIVVAGTNEKNHIIDYVNRHFDDHPDETEVSMHVLDRDDITDYEETGIISGMDDRSRAHIKVQEGCERFCSYCVIPFARGRARSRDEKDVLAEARNLVNSGFREVVLTGINTALYGVDLPEYGGRSGIDKLIARVADIEGDFRIRVGSLEPNVVDEETVRAIISQDKLCHHMHFSIQSGCDAVLRRMNRRYDVASYKKLASILRSGDPLYGITTDIIVGFPGETEEEFEETLRSVREIGFSRVHAFRYSQRSGTAAAKMPDQIPGPVKSSRIERLMEVASETEKRFMEANVGHVRKVLFEHEGDMPGTVEGYTDNYIRTVCRTDDPETVIGSIRDVRIDSPDSFTEDRVLGTIL